MSADPQLIVVLEALTAAIHGLSEKLTSVSAGKPRSCRIPTDAECVVIREKLSELPPGKYGVEQLAAALGWACRTTSDSKSAGRRLHWLRGKLSDKKRLTKYRDKSGAVYHIVEEDLQ